VVYVLHTFQKKSKTRRKTPKPEIALVKECLKRAEEHYQEWIEKRKRNRLFRSNSFNVVPTFQQSGRGAIGLAQVSLLNR
jgi:hypothetical protein